MSEKSSEAVSYTHLQAKQTDRQHQGQQSEGDGVVFFHKKRPPVCFVGVLLIKRMRRGKYDRKHPTFIEC